METKQEHIEKELKESEAWAEQQKKKKYANPEITGRTGGVYIPPFKLKRQQAAFPTDKSTVEYQRVSWDLLRKSINGLINKVNASNLTNIVHELFNENIIRGRGLLLRSVMKAQMASPAFTNVYAALIGVINTKMPEIGELLLKRNDKLSCISYIKFIAHLVNQQVAHEIIALQLLTLLLEKPTDDSVEIAVSFLKEAGARLLELSPRGVHAIFERFRAILHEGLIEKRIQYVVEDLFVVRKNNFSDFIAVIPELDISSSLSIFCLFLIVDMDEQYTHELNLAENYDPEDSLNIFHLDNQYDEHEKEYETIRNEILGGYNEEVEDDTEKVEGDNGESQEEEEEEEKEVIHDQTELKDSNLRKTVYHTIMSSVDIEECAHKLLKIQIEEGQEAILCRMILDCCVKEKTYTRFYGLLGQRFCLLDPKYQDAFDDIFALQYATIHRLETNKLRNAARFYSHLLFSDSLDWGVLEYIQLTEEDTTASQRIFVKILFQELNAYLGIEKLKEKISDPKLSSSFVGIFPKDNAKNIRFSINYFTSIGLGPLTDDMRALLKEQQQRLIEEQKTLISNSPQEESSSSDSEFDSETSDDEKIQRKAIEEKKAFEDEIKELEKRKTKHPKPSKSDSSSYDSSSSEDSARRKLKSTFDSYREKRKRSISRSRSHSRDHSSRHHSSRHHSSRHHSSRHSSDKKRRR